MNLTLRVVVAIWIGALLLLAAFVFRGLREEGKRFRSEAPRAAPAIVVRSERA